MRNLKFRGICLASGNMVFGGGIDTQRDTPKIINQGINYFVDAKTVGQFTGSKDEDGIDIYSGDIVEEVRLLASGPSISNLEVKYLAPSFRVGDLSLCKYMGITWKVIGNIHQNKDLLND